VATARAQPRGGDGRHGTQNQRGVLDATASYCARARDVTPDLSRQPSSPSPPPSPPPPHCPTSSSSSRAPRAHCRLKDVEHSDGRLYLVFEWVDKDLKKYMDSLKNPDGSSSMGMPLIKVRERGERRGTEGGPQQR
jgi:hypothetical protein